MLDRAGHLYRIRLRFTIQGGSAIVVPCSQTLPFFHQQYRWKNYHRYRTAELNTDAFKQNPRYIGSSYIRCF